jgi:hypothetical protein
MINLFWIVRFEVLTAVTLKITAFWDVMLCSWADSPLQLHDRSLLLH